MQLYLVHLFLVHLYERCMLRQSLYTVKSCVLIAYIYTSIVDKDFVYCRTWWHTHNRVTFSCVRATIITFMCVLLYCTSMYSFVHQCTVLLYRLLSMCLSSICALHLYTPQYIQYCRQKMRGEPSRTGLFPQCMHGNV